MLKLNAGLCFHYESSESLQEPGAGFHSLSPFPPSFLLGRAGHGMLASERALAGQGRRVSGLPHQPGDSSLSRTGAPVCTLGPVLQTVPLNRPGSAGLSMLRGPCPSNRGACCPMESQQHVQHGGSPGLRVTDSECLPCVCVLADAGALLLLLLRNWVMKASGSHHHWAMSPGPWALGDQLRSLTGLWA